MPELEICKVPTAKGPSEQIATGETGGYGSARRVFPFPLRPAFAGTTIYKAWQRVLKIFPQTAVSEGWMTVRKVQPTKLCTFSSARFPGQPWEGRVKTGASNPTLPCYRRGGRRSALTLRCVALLGRQKSDGPFTEVPLSRFPMECSGEFSWDEGIRGLNDDTRLPRRKLVRSERPRRL